MVRAERPSMPKAKKAYDVQGQPWTQEQGAELQQQLEKATTTVKDLPTMEQQQFTNPDVEPGSMSSELESAEDTIVRLSDESGRKEAFQSGDYKKFAASVADEKLAATDITESQKKAILETVETAAAQSGQRFETASELEEFVTKMLTRKVEALPKRKGGTGGQETAVDLANIRRTIRGEGNREEGHGYYAKPLPTSAPSTQKQKKGFFSRLFGGKKSA